VWINKKFLAYVAYLSGYSNHHMVISRDITRKNERGESR
jgi:hypothetical protein